MERLHASAEDGGIGGQVFHLPAGVAQTLDKLLCAAGAQEFHALLMQFGQEFFQSVFVEDRDKRGLHLFCFSHKNTYVYEFGIYLRVRKVTNF